MDERDGKGRANGNNAKVKQLFKIDLDGAVDVSAMDGLTAATHAVAKTLFLDIVQVLTATASPPGTFLPRWRALPSVRTSGAARKRFTPSGWPTTTISFRQFLMRLEI